MTIFLEFRGVYFGKHEFLNNFCKNQSATFFIPQNQAALEQIQELAIQTPPSFIVRNSGSTSKLRIYLLRANKSFLGQFPDGGRTNGLRQLVKSPRAIALTPLTRGHATIEFCNTNRPRSFLHHLRRITLYDRKLIPNTYHHRYTLRSNHGLRVGAPQATPKMADQNTFKNRTYRIDAKIVHHSETRNLAQRVKSRANVTFVDGLRGQHLSSHWVTPSADVDDKCPGRGIWSGGRQWKLPVVQVSPSSPATAPALAYIARNNRVRFLFGVTTRREKVNWNRLGTESKSTMGRKVRPGGGPRVTGARIPARRELTPTEPEPRAGGDRGSSRGRVERLAGPKRNLQLDSPGVRIGVPERKLVGHTWISI